MPAIRIQILIWHEEIMKQNRLFEDPVRSVFLSYLVPSVSATLVTSIYILAFRTIWTQWSWVWRVWGTSYRMSGLKPREMDASRTLQ